MAHYSWSDGTRKKLLIFSNPLFVVIINKCKYNYTGGNYLERLPRELPTVKYALYFKS